MPKRTSPNQIHSITDLNNLDKIVVDKRNDKRADPKRKAEETAIIPNYSSINK